MGGRVWGGGLVRISAAFEKWDCLEKAARTLRATEAVDVKPGSQRQGWCYGGSGGCAKDPKKTPPGNRAVSLDIECSWVD
jgi:hypothetical protein